MVNIATQTELVFQADVGTQTLQAGQLMFRLRLIK